MSHSDLEPATASPGYEVRDVNIRVVLWLGVAVAVCTAVVCAALWFLVRDFQRRAERRDPRPSPWAAQKEQPPAPRLQSAPVADYQEFRRREDEVLSSYGWVDREKGTVRIPVERAMELLVERQEAAARGGGEAKEP